MNRTTIIGSAIMIATSCAAGEIIGNVRIQPLGPHLVRVEQKAPNGFVDSETFTIVDRSSENAAYERIEEDGRITIKTEQYRVTVPTKGRSFEDVRIENSEGQLIRKLGPKDLERAYMPSPSALPKSWILADNPRVIPPAWGALPPPEELDQEHSGWDLKSNAPDLYIFFPADSGYKAFRSDFIRIAGPVPLPPLYAFGLWYSRYHPYSEETALQRIDDFHDRKIPLDVFVCDTDWRVGASCGYGINKDLFPDMERFIEKAHSKNVRLMYNDHPEPVDDHAMTRKELAFRQEGLTSLLEMGADVWWFDRNWHTHLHSPMEGLNKEVWGMRLYHDITLAHRPNQRPLIMSNVDGINNGYLEYPSHPAAHRFPIWWTGDTVGEWKYLKLGVQNGVDEGIHSLLPYVNEDLGGHHNDIGSEFYTRFMQFGAFSPITRIHSTVHATRFPWQYDERVEQIVGDYFRLRYRLLPMIYTAAHAAHQSGQPILRRCDLEWPDHAEARDNTQYLFGDDLLIAPVISAAKGDQPADRKVWIPEGEWEDAWTGETHAGPAAIHVRAALHEMPIFIRRGGIILTAPQSLTTKDMAWSNIVVDVYVPTTDGSTTRHLYVDDGISNAYTNGSRGISDIVMTRTGNELVLTVRPNAKLNQFHVSHRDWTLRVHLSTRTSIKAAMLDGEEIENVATLNPAAGNPATIFTGPGSAPHPKAGPVVEIPVRRKSPDTPIHLQISLKS